MLHSAPLLYLCTFLMGVHSTVFGPVKYAYLPQHLRQAELVGGNGLVEMGTFVAILIGTIVGGVRRGLGEHGASAARRRRASRSRWSGARCRASCRHRRRRSRICASTGIRSAKPGAISQLARTKTAPCS